MRLFFLLCYKKHRLLKILLLTAIFPIFFYSWSIYAEDKQSAQPITIKVWEYLRWNHGPQGDRFG